MTAHTRPMTPKTGYRDISPTAIGLLAVLMAGLGLIVEFRPTSINSGNPTLYIGFVLAVGATILAMGTRLRVLFRLFTLAVLALCLINLVQRSNDLHTQRLQWQQQVHAGVTKLKNELPNH